MVFSYLTLGVRQKGLLIVKYKMVLFWRKLVLLCPCSVGKCEMYMYHEILIIHVYLLYLTNTQSKSNLSMLVGDDSSFLLVLTQSSHRNGRTLRVVRWQGTVVVCSSSHRFCFGSCICVWSRYLHALFSKKLINQ